MTEDFTATERARLEPRFTNVDRPCFALRSLPETVRGALFARYSRSAKPLRRLYLDEFDADLPPAGGAGEADGNGGRAAALYDRVLGQYGTTRSPSSAARTSPARASPTCSPRCSSAGG